MLQILTSNAFKMHRVQLFLTVWTLCVALSYSKHIFCIITIISILIFSTKSKYLWFTLYLFAKAEVLIFVEFTT